MTTKVGSGRSPFSELAALTALVITIAPVGWLVINAFQYTRNILLPGISGEFTIHNFATIFGPRSDLLQQLFNSIVIVTGSTLLCIVLGSMAAYSLSKLRWSAVVTATLLGVVLFIQLIPPMTLVPALFVTLLQFNLLDTRTGLIMLHTVFHLPFAVLLLKVYFDTIPDDLRESALVDGASEFRAFLRVMVPLAGPGVAAVTIMTAILSWNEFLLGLTLTRGPGASPITVGIAVLVQEYNVRYGEMTAAGTLAAIPIILLGIFAHRYIVTGLTAGSVKG